MVATCGGAGPPTSPPISNSPAGTQQKVISTAGFPTRVSGPFPGRSRAPPPVRGAAPGMTPSG
jgi:hypothetical protein